VKVRWTEEQRKIAGYPCSEWQLTAGRYLYQERWVARALSVPDFSPEVEKVVMASITDPVGRGLMKLVLQGRRVDGLTLAGTIRFRTLGQEGTMSWEALRVDTHPIAPAAWEVPHGYQRWTPKVAARPQ
jgi:hypothetical protein